MATQNSLSEIDELLDSLADPSVSPSSDPAPVAVAIPAATRGDGSEFSVTGLSSLPFAYDESFFRLVSKEAQNISLEYLDEHRDAMSFPKVSPSAEFALSNAKRLLCWSASSTKMSQCVVEVAEDVRYNLSKGVLWIPMATYRPGSAVQGIAFVRYFNPLNMIASLPGESNYPTITLTNSKNEHVRSMDVARNAPFTVFRFEIPSDARSGEWKLTLKDQGSSLDTKTFEVKHISKPDMKVTAVNPPLACGLRQQQEITINCEYFFGAAATRLAEMSYSCGPVGLEGGAISGKETDLKNPKGQYSFPIDCSHQGPNTWTVSVQDHQGRIGGLSGTYRVAYGLKDKPLSAASITIDYRLLDGGRDNTAIGITRPVTTVVELTVTAADQSGAVIPELPFEFLMEGAGEYWNFVDGKAPSLKTNAEGKCTFSLQFTAAVTSHEPCIAFVKARHGKQACEASLLLEVRPWAPRSLSIAVNGVVGGENESIEIEVSAPGGGVDTKNEFIFVDVYGEKCYFSAHAKVGEKILAPIPSHVRESVRVRASIAGEQKEAPTEIIVPNSFSGMVHSDCYEVSAPKEVTTGSPINVKISGCESLFKYESGRAVACMVDKRMPAHEQVKAYTAWADTFTVQQQWKEFAEWKSFSINGWTTILAKAVQFDAPLCGLQWRGWACLGQSTNRVVAVNAKDWDAVKKYEPLIKSFLSESITSSHMEKVASWLPVQQLHVFYTTQWSEDMRTMWSWARTGSPSSELLTALRGRIAFLTNNLIRPRPPTTDLVKRLYDRLRDAADRMSLENDLLALKKALSPYEQYEPPEPVHRQDFIEMEFVETDVPEGSTEVNVSFPRGSDAITEYDIYVFVATPSYLIIESAMVRVKNKYFTQTVNPGEMVLGDKCTLRTIVQNTDAVKPMRKVTLHMALQGLLLNQEDTVSFEEIAPGDAESVKWEVTATEIGAAKMTLTLRSDVLHEVSHFDTPLQVLPPGEPLVEREHAVAKTNEPAVLTYEIYESEAWVSARLKVIPEETSAALIDGAESLKQYPYGCLEQTYSSTIPNLFLYKYIASKKEQTPHDAQLLEELKKNLIAGKDRLLSRYRCQDGGYTMWGGAGKSSVFHSALILSLFGLLKDVIPVPEDVYTSTLDFLLKNKNADHHYESRSYSYVYPDMTLSNYGMTASVFHSAALCGTEMNDTLLWLKTNLLKNRQDISCVALVLWALTVLPAYSEKHSLFMRNLKLLLLTSQTAEGNWKNSASSSALCTGDVEPTAYAIIALSHVYRWLTASGLMRPDEGAPLMDAMKRGIDWLMSRRRFSGYSSSRDTLFATWAVGEAAHLLQPKPAKFTIEMNGAVWKQFDLTQLQGAAHTDTLLQLRELSLPTPKQAGSTVVKVISAGTTANVLLEVERYFFGAAPADLHEKPKVARGRQIGHIDISSHTQNIPLGDVMNVTVNFTPTDSLDAVMLEIPVPAGFKAPDMSKVSTSGPKASLKEYNDRVRRITLFYPRLITTDNISISMPLEAHLRGNVWWNPCRAFQMYDPDNVSSSAGMQVSVSA